MFLPCFVPKGVIDELPHLFWIWQDPKADNTMYRKGLLKDWSLDHLEDYGWYIECPRDCTPPFEVTLKENHEPSFQKKLASSRGSDLQASKGEGGKGISLRDHGASRRCDNG
jgi:hypothetical protein